MHHRLKDRHQAWSMLPGTRLRHVSLNFCLYEMHALLTHGHEVAVMGISQEVYETMNASKYAVRVPPEAGSGYMGVFEGIHLIHCVVSFHFPAKIFS